MTARTRPRIAIAVVLAAVVLALGSSSIWRQLPGRTVLDASSMLGWDEVEAILGGRTTAAGGGTGLGFASGGHYTWRRDASVLTVELAYEDDPFPRRLLAWEEDGAVVRVEDGAGATHELLLLSEACLMLRVTGTHLDLPPYELSTLREVLRQRVAARAVDRCRPSVLHELR